MCFHHRSQEWSVHYSLRLLSWNWIWRLHVLSEATLRVYWVLSWSHSLWEGLLRWAWLHLLLTKRSLSMRDRAWINLSGGLWWERLTSWICCFSWKFYNYVLLIWWCPTLRLLLLVLKDLLFQLLWRCNILSRNDLRFKWINKGLLQVNQI